MRKRNGRERKYAGLKKMIKKATRVAVASSSRPFNLLNSTSTFYKVLDIGP